MATTYDLSKILTNMHNKTDFECEDNVQTLKTANINSSAYTTDKGKYTILKYDKTKLTTDNVLELGLFRSVILKDGIIKCFSPPK